MSDEAALLNAIVGHPGEDTPRLAYADWLEENEAPIQADFVRTQCALASCPADAPEYPDLLERYAELVAQFGPLAKLTAPEFPPEFVFEPRLDLAAENFCRGFPHTVHGVWHHLFGPTDAADEEIDRFCAALPKLFATTTVRQLRLTETSDEAVARVLAAPAAESLTGLFLAPYNWHDDSDEVVCALAASKAVPNLERLSLYTQASTAALAALAGAKFDRLVHFDLPMLTGTVRELRAVTGTKWFRGLRRVRAGASDRPLEADLLSTFAQMPHLDALDLRFQNDPALKALGAARGFPSLARLEFWTPLTKEGLARLVKGAFPRLAELFLYNVRGYHLTALLRARWLPHLRVLSLHTGTLTDKSVGALSKSAANLRILRLEEIPLGPKALAALGDGARFPNLTTLALGTARNQKLTTADLVTFANELSLPRVRHLDLSGRPFGDTGAKALAANPALANLTRLALRGCGITEKGFAALVRSPHLQQLIELDVTGNKLKTASALRAPKRLPRLAAVRLDGNTISPAAYRQLTATRGLVV